MKKFISVLLVILTALSFFSLIASAAGEIGDSSFIKSRTAAAAETGSDKIVARIYLCSTAYVFPVAGHVWIYVENLTDKPFKVGLHTAKPGEGVSVSTNSFSVEDGWGIYYNLENYRQGTKYKPEDIWTICKDLTRAELNSLSDYLANRPNMWSWIFNCTYFACKVWNDNTNSHLMTLGIPGLAHMQVILSGGRRGRLVLSDVEPYEVKRQVGSGKNAYLKDASPESLPG